MRTLTELTWKVLLKLTQIYFNRGDLNKAKDFSVYGKKLIYSYFAKTLEMKN